MALVNCYLTLQALKDAVKDPRSTADSAYERAITAASRWIDGHCRRHFWLAPAPGPRLVRATSRAVLNPGDFATADGAAVEVDAAGTGTFTPLDASAWQPEPLAPLPGWPFERLAPVAHPAGWPIHGPRAGVRVTARWGWPEVPAQVEEACLLLALAYVRAKDISGTRTGFESEAVEGASPFTVVEHLLKDFAPMTRGGGV